MLASSPDHTIDLQGLGPVRFVRSRRARRLTITLRPFEAIRVAIPGRLPLARALSFVEAKRPWIRHQRERLRALEARLADRERLVAAIDRTEARRLLSARLAELAAAHGFSYNRLTIRCQKTRWGSCSARNNISLNVQLMLLPEDLRDLVLLHELVHTRVKHHGPAFWAELERLIPDARQQSRRLKDHALAGRF